MQLREVGALVRERRESAGLSQERLARMAGLSRATVNQLETGVLVDLGVAKLTRLLELLGIRVEPVRRGASQRGLLMASRTASVSYREPIDANRLADALASGELPHDLVPQIATLLDEAPLALLVSAVEEAARRRDVPPTRVWRHLVRWARELRSPRPAWT